MILAVLKTWCEEKPEQKESIFRPKSPINDQDSKENSYHLKHATELSNLSIYSSRTNQEGGEVGTTLKKADDIEEEVSPQIGPAKYNIQILEPVIAPEDTGHPSDQNIKSRASIVDLKDQFSRSKGFGHKVTFAERVTSSREIGRFGFISDK
jgi:primase-polymerase (primpol)-like protein